MDDELWIDRDYSGLKVSWLARRGEADIDFTRSRSWFAIGVRDSGKSSLLEFLATRYLEHGACVFDINGAADGEGLAWLRSPYARANPGRVLVLRGRGVSAKIPGYRVIFAEDLQLSDFLLYDIIVSATPLYLNKARELEHVEGIIDKLFHRLGKERLVALLIREAQDIFYSRVRARDEQRAVKAKGSYIQREARHEGLAMLLDTLKATSIDDDVRHEADYWLYTAQGSEGLPSTKRWLYSIFDPRFFVRLRKGEFVIEAKEGPVGVGASEYQPWHKREEENIIRELGATITYEGAGSVTDEETHRTIVEMYAAGLTYRDIADHVGLSASSCWEQVREHNKRVGEDGECALCGGSELATALLRVRRKNVDVDFGELR